MFELSADGAPKKYRYKVVERTFKENFTMVPGKPDIFLSDEVYVSTALEAADEPTRQAVEKLRKHHQDFRKTTPGDAFAIIAENADLKEQLREAIAALKAKGEK